MAPEMMTKTSKLQKKKQFLILFLIFSSIFAFAESSPKQWKIAAQKFESSKGQEKNAVSSGTAEVLPVSIMEKLNRYLQRNVFPDERFERKKYQLRTERQSLYLQLTSEYKKRDSLILQDYSESKLKSKIKEENNKIQEIKDKINKNLEELKTLEMETEEKMLQVSGEFESIDDDYKSSEMDKIINLFKRIFVKDESLITFEDIVFYQDSHETLFAPSQLALEQGYLSYKMEKEVYGAGINTLITGSFSNYEDFISVNVDVYMYPGAKKIGTITEVGSVDEMETLASSIANQIIPMLTNGMPVQVAINVESESEKPKYELFIDDVLQSSESEIIVLESGIHSIQIVSNGFKTVSTTYHFSGNTKYNIDVNLVEEKDGFIQIGVENSIFGEIFVNGEKVSKINDSKSQIKINGNSILGEFVAENGETDFFYVPPKLIFDENYVTIKPKPRDRENYIDTRRKWMYGSYSALMVSLIPFFYTYGNLYNNSEKYKNKQISYEEAQKWQTAYNVSMYVTIGCGLFWGYELIRYFIAANSVLPQKAKAGSLDEFEYYDFSSVSVEQNNENLQEETQNTDMDIGE